MRKLRHISIALDRHKDQRKDLQAAADVALAAPPEVALDPVSLAVEPAAPDEVA